MGRHIKNVVGEDGLDRRETGYYSTPAFIAQYFYKTLVQLKPNASTVYDPCVGRGELLQPFRSTSACLLGSDIISLSDDPFFTFHHLDYLKEAAVSLEQPLLPSRIPSSDIIVANPPYNCHEHEYLRANKDTFVRAFGKSAFLNFYSLFITAIIKTSRPGTAIGLITLDSFLTARGHEPLRSLLRTECRLHEVLLCPTDLFRSQGADVRTCIIICEKGEAPHGAMRTLNRPVSSSDFKLALEKRAFTMVQPDDAFLTSPNDRGEFLIGVPKSIRTLFDEPRLGELFACKTGISTGNDKQYLRPEPELGYSVPFYKNPGNRRFFTEPDAFLTDDFLEITKSVSNFMVRNKEYIGRPGITCSSMGVSFGAAYMPEGGAFGVNANIFPDQGDLWWLLAFLNSSICNYLVRGVMLRSNMITAGYVSRIPVPNLDQNTRNRLSTLAQEAYTAKPSLPESRFHIRAIDHVLFKALGIPNSDQAEIECFCTDIIRRT